MGLLRTLLALSVVAGHAGGIFGVVGVGGVIAVQSFYIISGFYMSLILNEKYTADRGGYKTYLGNRLLRLLPIYWTILVITALIGMIGWVTHGHSGALEIYRTNFHELGWSTLAFLAFTNLFVFFQDWVMFMRIDGSTGTLAFTPNFRATQPALYSFLFIPQAWTLGVELTFYLLAPFLVRLRMRWVGLLIFCSLLGRFAVQRTGWYHDPWTYRFFPFELVFFLLGRLAYRVYSRIRSANLPQAPILALGIVMLIWTVLFDRITWAPQKYLYFAFLTMSLPLVFHLTRNWHWDRWIGEFSYPIYISHVLVISSLTRLGAEKYLPIGATGALVTFFVAWTLTRFVGNPIENIRQARAASPVTKLTPIAESASG